MRKEYLLIFVMHFIFLVPGYNQEGKNLTQFVNPFIGTAEHGHVFLGANVPFGTVQLGPTNMSTGWDWCSGYNYADSTIAGFAHTHLSGTGIGDLGDILVMPTTGVVKTSKGKIGDTASGYYSIFSHKEEKVRPGYYSVRLQRYNILAELTATERVGFHRYTFPSPGSAQIIFDLKEGIGDRATKTVITKVSDRIIAGYRYSRGWAQDQRIFFAAVFSQSFSRFVIYEDSTEQKPGLFTGRATKAVVFFSINKYEGLECKVAISPVSTENALANIEAELPGWDFDAVAKAANQKWEKELEKVEVTSHDTDRLTTFYTALYHTMIAPSIFNDANGDYFGTDKKVYKQAPFTNLTTFSLWDTYRAAHPLFTLLQPTRVNDMVNTMLMIYKQQGKLPVWHLMGNETNTMPGYSGVQVVVDAYLKGFHGFDTALAWEAVKTTAMQDERGLHYVKQYGFIPADSMVESVAMGLEYAIADWAIAQMALRMGKQADYAYFSKRASYYRNYFDPTTKFMRGRVSTQAWREPFSPFVSRHMKDDFTEGNAWQYTWLVPQDVKGLIQLLGGVKQFRQKLDSLFIVTGDLGKEASADITGLIGQYAHGNEPSHHIAYLYTYVGQPWKTAEKIRYILDNLYSAKPKGLCGNEDVGQMSAWYVLSALGFYQVNPANGVFIIGSPVFDSVTLNLCQGKVLQVVTNNNSKKNKYIQQIILNGKPYSKTYIPYKTLMAGGKMIVDMGPSPSSQWGIPSSTWPN